MKLSIDQILSAYSKLKAEQANAHREADAIDSKKLAEEHLDENCPICKAGCSILEQTPRELEKFGEFCGEIAARSFGQPSVHIHLEDGKVLAGGAVTPDRVALLIMTAMQIGHRLGRREAFEKQVSDGYIWKRGIQ